MRIPMDEVSGESLTLAGDEAGTREKLGRLDKGERGTIAAVGGEGSDPAVVKRLLQMGLVEGAEVEVVHEAPISRDPIAVRVRGSLLALRRREADCVEVIVSSEERRRV